MPHAVEVISAAIALAFLIAGGAYRWFTKPSRDIDLVWIPGHTRASEGTHRAMGELDMLEDPQGMSIEAKIHRLNFLTKMGYIVLTRPPEGVYLFEGIYRKDLQMQIPAKEIKKRDIIDDGVSKMIVDDVTPDQGPGLGILVRGQRISDGSPWSMRFINPDEMVECSGRNL
jgi:hypothetical protein